ncbi:MAG TPA: hypothetical protein VL086_09140 [Candidatus Nitrosotalea sp.]|nr:hypothetical protein [Candidatus Nitrosotalea sp.]
MARARLLFTARDVVDIFGLENEEALDRLVRSGVIAVSAYSPRGAPLYSADELQRAGKQILPRPEAIRRDQTAR